MPASLIVTAMGITAAAGYSALTIAAVTFGVRLVTTLVIASIISKRQGGNLGGTGTQQIGNRVQLTPSTDNKIPVVYGSAYMKPIITDAKISVDQKTMWYVLTFSEAMNSDATGTISFGDLYWGDKKLVFGDVGNPEKVTGWVNSDGTFEDQPNGNLFVYLYRDGSDVPVNTAQTAVQVMRDGQIPVAQWWTSTNKMTKLVFAIVKIVYSQEKNLTGLAEVTAVVNNTLTKPGSVIKDYLTNSRYGAGLNINKVNTATLDELDAYSDETISYTPAGGGAKVTTNRFRINGPVDTTKNFLDNLSDITDNCDSWLQWNEARGQWGVIVNRSYLDLDPLGTNVRTITSGEIIGGIDINPIDLNQTYNEVEVQFPNTKIKDQAGYYKLGITSFPNVVRSPNEPDNTLGLSLPYTNNIVQAQYIGARRLVQSREDLTVTFTMAFTGITIDAGDVIGLNHETYGWGPTYGMPKGKLFRVTQVQESKADDGTLYARIVASEYNDDVYDDNNIDLRDFTPALNTGITNPVFISKPNAPTFANINTSSSAPSFNVVATVPTTGTTLGLEFWYGTTSTISGNNYTLFATNFPSGGPVFTTGTTNAYTVTGLGNGDYWWSIRALGARSKSDFSNTAKITWVPEFISEVVGKNVVVNFQPPNISVPRLGYDLIPDLSSVVIKAFGLVGAEQSEYVDVLTDSDPAFLANTWRIATSSVNNYTTASVVTLENITLDVASITAGLDGSATFPTPTAISSFPARVTIPIRFKDAAGNIFQGSPAICELNFNNQLDTGPQLRFVSPFISVPRLTDDLIPDFSNSAAILEAEIDGDLIPYVNALSDSDPLFTTGTWRIGFDAASNYNTPFVVRYEGLVIDPSLITEVGDRALFPNIEEINGAPAVMSVYGRYKSPSGMVYNLNPAVTNFAFSDQGAAAVTLDFSVSGGAFVLNTNSTFTPSSLTVTALPGNWGVTSISWTSSGTTAVSTSTVNYVGDTLTFSPTTTTTLVSISATAIGANTSTTRTATFSVLRQPSNGTKGDQGSRGFVPLAYIPILVDPNSATNSELTAAWLAATGYTPIDQDTGSFTFGALNKAYTYNGTTWTAAAVEISGDLIATGTVRANRLAANEIFTNKLASTNSTATFGSTTTTVGYWIDGSNGTARFAGNVSIGNNLTVAGLITASVINNGVITRDKLAPGTLLTDLGTAVIATSVGGGGGTSVPSQWDGFFDDGALNRYYRTLGYYEFKVPDQFIGGSISLKVNISFNLTQVLDFTGAGSVFNPDLYVYINGKNNPGTSTPAFYGTATTSTLFLAPTIDNADGTFGVSRVLASSFNVANTFTTGTNNRLVVGYTSEFPDDTLYTIENINITLTPS